MKHILLILFFMLCPVLAIAQEVRQDVLKRAGAAWREFSHLEADFIQTSSTGAKDGGRIYLQKPGLLRMEYKSPMLLLVDGRSFIYVDKKLDQVSYVPLAATPAGILLKKDIDFNSPDIAISQAEVVGGEALVAASLKKDPGTGELTLRFDAKTYDFLGWKIIDALGVETALTLKNIKHGGKKDAKFFLYEKQRNYAGEEDIGDF